jgi:hypothetical protein
VKTGISARSISEINGDENDCAARQVKFSVQQNRVLQVFFSLFSAV